MREINVEGLTLPGSWKCGAIRPYSTALGDSHLSIILCFDEDAARAGTPKFVTWSYNWESGGCNHGNYTRVLAEAVSDFHKRGNFDYTLMPKE
jgi:hypothetical protein